MVPENIQHWMLLIHTDRCEGVVQFKIYKTWSMLLRVLVDVQYNGEIKNEINLEGLFILYIFELSLFGCTVKWKVKFWYI